MASIGLEGFVEGGKGSKGSYLAGAIAENFPSCNIPELGVDNANFDGGFTELIEKCPALKEQSENKVKTCECGKANAYTMNDCNNCGASLSNVPISRTPNLIVGMIFGVANALFPLKISMRLEEQTVMVFDDMLAITNAHLLAVPTDTYIEDVRWLFVAPKKGLKILTRMDDAAWKAMSNCHLKDRDWRNKVLSSVGAEESNEELRGRMVRAFNLPPSQYQLHLQYMLPPLTPFNCYKFKNGIHFAKGRHFPYDYVYAALEAMSHKEMGWADAPTMSAAELIRNIKVVLRIDYDTFYQDDMDKLIKNNEFLANWRQDDFKHIICVDVVDGKDAPKCDGTVMEADNWGELNETDKMALQTYGRPYTDGKPSGVFYTYARSLGKLPTFPALDADGDAAL